MSFWRKKEGWDCNGSNGDDHDELVSEAHALPSLLCLISGLLIARMHMVSFNFCSIHQCIQACIHTYIHTYIRDTARPLLLRTSATELPNALLSSSPLEPRPRPLTTIMSVKTSTDKKSQEKEKKIVVCHPSSAPAKQALRFPIPPWSFQPAVADRAIFDASNLPRRSFLVPWHLPG